jgi:hypothetical protein
MAIDLATIEGAVALAESIVSTIITEAPAIEKGIASAEPYVQAIAGMIQGTNATQAQIQALLASANISSTQFDTPLPPDDGSTTT